MGVGGGGGGRRDAAPSFCMTDSGNNWTKNGENLSSYI